ncbi:MAG: NADPH-dependent 7-cyano-7-deazaguanine reductase QueF [Elusimicrobia bacterium RIFOXYA2_FULL_40_6]|nr:MAG: NADPH-dependent 7-cyano-7-deazaguanine reductase QueF [Elusimicrobia bacterium RIFOXYA2_FULL_40_6]
MGKTVKLNYDVREIKKISPEALQAIAYEYPGKKIEVTTSTDEFTCVCPWSGLPDFAKISISYVPDKKLVELKSLKMYLQSYRNAGIVHESVVNKILGDLVKCCTPKEMSVEALFNSRGGIITKVVAQYKK